MFDPIDETQPLSPLVAAYTSAERRANVATQLRDRFGRWVEMGRDFSFKFKSGGNVKNATGKFVGAVPNRPGYGLVLVEDNEDFGSSVVEVNMKSGQQVLAKLSADALRKAGVTKAGHDVNGNPIGDVIDTDIEDISALKTNEITDLDRELAQGKLTPEQREAIDAQRASAPDYESTNVVAEIDATKEDLGEGYRQLQEALGRTPEAEKEKDGPAGVYDLKQEKFEDIVELLDKDPKKLSDSDLLKVVAQERDYAQIAERDESGFPRFKAREAEAEAIKRGLVKDRYSVPSGTPIEDIRLIPKDGEGLPSELKTEITGDEIQDIKIASIAEALKAEGRFPVPRQSSLDTWGKTSDVTKGAKLDYAKVYEGMSSEDPEFAKKYPTFDSFWERVVDLAVDERTQSPNDLDQINQEMKEINKGYAKYVMGLDPDNGTFTVYRNAINNAFDERDAAVGYVSTNKNLAFDYNANTRVGEQANGRYEITVKPDEVNGMIGYSQVEDEYALTIGKGVTYQEGRVKKVGELETLKVAPWHEEAVSKLKRGQGATPYRGHSFVGQFDFLPISKNPLQGDSLQDFLNDNNITMDDWKNKFDELHGEGAYQRFKDSGRENQVSLQSLQRMFVDLGDGTYGLDITKLSPSGEDSAGNASYGDLQNPSSFVNDYVDNKLKFLSLIQDITGEPFMVHKNLSKDILQDVGAIPDETIRPEVPEAEPFRKATPEELRPKTPEVEPVSDDIRDGVRPVEDLPRQIGRDARIPDDRVPDSTPPAATFKTASRLSPGDEVKMPDGTFRTVDDVRSVDSGSMVFFKPVDGGRRRSSKIYEDNDLVEIKPPQATEPAPQADSVELARQLNEIAGRRAQLEIVAGQMRRFGGDPQGLEDAEALLAKLDEEFEAKRAEYEASLPDTSEQDAIDERERLKSELQWYDNEQGDVARKIDEGVSGLEIIDWLRENSNGWREAESDLATSWAVDLPRRPQREAWAKFEKLRSDLEGYNVPPSDGDATPAEQGGNDRNRVYRELAESLGIEESELRNGVTGEGSEQARRIADSIEYFGGLIDNSKGDKDDLYGRLSNVLRQDVENAKTNTPGVGPEVLDEPQNLIERVAKEEGGTVEPSSGMPLKTGIAVGLRGLNEELVDTAFFDRELGALAIEDYLARNYREFNAGNKLGLWHDKDNREVTLDISRIFDENSEQELERAMAWGRENNQQGIFGIEFRGYIDTGGTGDRGRARRQREESRLSGEPSSDGLRPEGLGESVGRPEDGTVEADLRQSDEEHPEESVEFTEELGQEATEASGEVRDYVSVLGSPDVDISEDKSDIIDATSEIDSAVEQKDGNLVMRGIRSLVEKIGALRDKLGAPEDSEEEANLESLASRLIGVRNSRKNKKDALDLEPSSLSKSEIVQDIEIPENIESNIFDGLRTPENIDYENLTESQAKLLKTLIDGKNSAILGMSNARDENNVEQFNRQYLLARIYAGRVTDLLADIELRGDKADIFGGIDNRIQNLKIIESSIVRGPGDTQDKNTEVIKNFKAIFVGKSGTAYELEWNYVGRLLNVYRIGPDGKRGPAVGYQSFSDRSGKWHFDSTSSRSVAKIFYETRYGKNKKPVTTAYVTVNDNRAKGDGLGGIMALASQFAIEGSKRKFQHSLHLLVDGNRSSKAVNGHDPSLHHPSQVEKLLHVKNSKVVQWWKDLGWVKTEDGPVDQSKRLFRDIFSSTVRSFESFYKPLGVSDSFGQEGPVWHLNGLLRQHADLYRDGFKANPTAKGQVPVPSVYENFLKGKTSNGTNPDFDVLEIIKEMSFEGGISKEEALTKLKAIRDSIEIAGNRPFPEALGFRRDIMDRGSAHLVDNLTRLIDKIDSEEFTDADKISRREVRPLEDVTPIKLDVLDLEQDPNRLSVVSKDIEKIYKEVEIDIPPAPREIGGDFSVISRVATAGGASRIQEEDVSPRDITGRIAPTSDVRPRGVRRNGSATVVTVLNEKHTPTVTEEQWRNGQASDDPRVIARNFSTSTLRKAYTRAVFPSAVGETISLRYQDGEEIEIGHAAIRDALQMQGENVDALLNASVATAYGQSWTLEDLPEPAVLDSETNLGVATRRDYSFAGGNRSNLAVITYEDKDSNGTIALIGTISPTDSESGTIIGRVIENDNGTYTLAVSNEEDAVPVFWPATANGLSRLRPIATVTDRNIALVLLEQEAQRRSVGAGELIAEIDRDQIVDSGNPVIQVSTPELINTTATQVREVQLGINGERYFIRHTSNSTRGDIFSIVTSLGIASVARVDRETDSQRNDAQVYRLAHNIDTSRLPEGSSNFGARFNTEEDAIRATGELLGIANGTTVNPVTNEPIRSLDELPRASVTFDGIRFTQNDLFVQTGFIVTPRGGQLSYTSRNLPNGPVNFVQNKYITGVVIGSGRQIQINYGSEEGKYTVRQRQDSLSSEQTSDFDSYAEALDFSRNLLKQTMLLENPESLLTTELEEATPEPETPVNEAESRVGQAVSIANSEPLVIDDSYTLASNESMGVTEASNPVRVYRDSEGKFWVVKRAAHTMFGDDFSKQVDMEIFASALYRTMGINASEIRRATVDGDENYLASPFIFRSQENIISHIDNAMESGDQARIDGFRKGIALDILMNNFDAYFNSDNMVVGGDGNVYRVDNGSAMFYTPSGRREAYGAGFTESSSIEEILNTTKRTAEGGPYALPFPNYDSVSGQNDIFDRDSEDMKRYVSEVVAPLTDEVLEQLVSIIRDDVDRQRTLDTLKYRRDGMLEYYGVPKLGEDGPFVSQVQKERLDEAEALGMPEGFLVIRRPEEDSIQVEHSEEEDGIPHSMVTITFDSENGKYDLVGFDRSLEPTANEVYETEEEALRRASEFVNQEEGTTPAPAETTAPEEPAVPANITEVAPRIVDSPRLLANLAQPQIVLNAVKQAFEGNQVLPNGDILVASRDFQGRTRGDNRVFRYEVVLHKTPNDDFVAYVRQYQIDANGAQVGDVSVGRFTDKSHSPEVTVSRVRALLNGNTSGRGINGSNPNNWFNNSSDIESEATDSATGQPLPNRFVEGRDSTEFIGDTGIPKTGNGAVDAFIQTIANQMSMMPGGPARQQFIDFLVRNLRNNSVLSGDQLEDVVERIAANREAPGANMVPYPSRDGNTIVRVGDKVRHTFNGVTKIGYVTKRTRISYQRDSGTYSYEDVVYVKFPGARGGSRRITTKNLEVLARSDGSSPLPVDSLGNAVQKPISGKKPNQLKWQDGSDGVAYLGAQGRTSDELRSSSVGYIESVTMPDGSVLYKMAYKDANGIERAAYYDANLNTMDEIKQMLLDKVR